MKNVNMHLLGISEEIVTPDEISSNLDRKGMPRKLPLPSLCTMNEEFL
jgi:hypothetical protein